MNRRVSIRILKDDGDNCTEGPTCPISAKVDGDPGYTYFVFKQVTDAEVLAAFAGHIGPGEALGKVPDRTIPEVR